MLRHPHHGRTNRCHIKLDCSQANSLLNQKHTRMSHLAIYQTGKPANFHFAAISEIFLLVCGENFNWPRSPVPTANMSIVPLSSSNIFSTFAVCLEHNSHIHIFFPENSVEMSGKFPLPFQCPCEIRCDRGLAVCTKFKTRDLGLGKVAFWTRLH